MTENLQNTETTLTGALLNGDSQKDYRITYKKGFYFEPVSDSLQRYMTGVSYPAVSDDAEKSALVITFEELSYVHILHYDFDGNLAEGELICNQGIAQDLVEIFYELYLNEYQLESVLLIDTFDGDDIASMEADNTSCFNYRVVAGSSSISKHAYGLAIDINPCTIPMSNMKKTVPEPFLPIPLLPMQTALQIFPIRLMKMIYATSSLSSMALPGAATGTM